MSAKVLLFLVEGYSDITALYYPFGLFFDHVDPSVELHFLKPVKDKGDITSNFSAEQNTIVKKINEWWGISDYLSKNGFSPSDVLEIVQIIDTDGVYIEDDRIQSVPLLKNVIYCSDAIQCDTPRRIIDRNLRKRHNITTLKSTNSLKIGFNAIPYSLYYFSCNLDHYIGGNRNLESRLKCDCADKFAYRFSSYEDVYGWFSNQETDQRTNVGGDYKASWEYLKKDYNSLKACSNIIVLLDRYLNK